MISIKDYARENGISYEAVRQQIARYKDELEGHIHKDGRTRFLDDEAVAFLQVHRMKEPVAVYEGSPDAELIAELKEKIKNLEAKNDALVAELIERDRKLDAARDKIDELQEEKMKLLEAPKEPEKPEKKGFLKWFLG